ncbi:ankyrin repeat domain-containing protein [Chryseobacterium wangxinyae]|uniref:ankyrin repeat domain-containing protein n=1 Tax=Chryseobacterium sp. CY350 TaxID=2997336 RepID=UPI00226E5905|nr:ankyrin repeat domain-containing protein [Chryseobacterium sp. CY350]MCY0978793.1 ankyrin repeat domain-containing protein [Chryseobacterium sp. CY350]WBZ93827.1 ankyrin repeat domain-containing protein [Chryseobacterium sp. CY350]
MKKIISATLFLAMSIFANGLFAQQVSKDQMKIFQTDNLQDFKKVFKKDDFNKCFAIKENSYDLLALSVKYERKNIFNFLLSNTTDVNRICNNQSPLMVAARYGKADMAQSLLKKGADKNLKNASGETAKDFAVKYEKVNLANILK